MGKATFTEWAGQGGAGCYRHRGRAMLLIADSDMGDAADAAIAAAGGRPMRRIAWAEVEAGLAAVVAAPVVLAEAGGVAPERSAASSTPWRRAASSPSGRARSISSPAI